MRDIGAEVRSAVDLNEIAKQAREAVRALNAAEERERQAEELREKHKRIAAEKRVEIGRLLVEARKAWPASGPKAAGWARFVADLGVSRNSALRYMELAGFVAQADVCNESPAPTYRDAGIDTRPRKSERPVDEPPPERPAPRAEQRRPIAADGLPVVSDEERAAIASAERARAEAANAARMGGHIDERAAKARDAIAAYAAAASEIARLHQRGIYLNDVTTSPEDHERALRLASDVVEMALSDLERINAVDGKAKRAQLALLRGGAV